MANKPTIGITAGEAQNMYYPSAPKVYGQQYTYVEAIERAGGVPLILPVVQDKAVLRQLYDLCEGILLAGGNDINPACYKAQVSPQTQHVHKERDQQEIQLWHWAKSDDKPVLGVCRGMQIMNVAQGGTLHQDIPTEVPTAGEHLIAADKYQEREYQIIHPINFAKDSKLAAILGTESVGANSYHHQAIKDLGKGLVPTGWSPDGLIEGIEVPSKRFALGIQAHPEALEAEIEPHWRKLFSAFVQAARGAN